MESVTACRMEAGLITIFILIVEADGTHPVLPHLHLLQNKFIDNWWCWHIFPHSYALGYQIRHILENAGPVLDLNVLLLYRLRCGTIIKRQHHVWRASGVLAGEDWVFAIVYFFNYYHLLIFI